MGVGEVHAVPLTDAPTQYARVAGLGPPMYVYFCAGGPSSRATTRRRCAGAGPGINITLFTGIFVFRVPVRFHRRERGHPPHAYAFANTYEPLTLWRRSISSIYESILVAFVGCVFTWMRMEAEDHPEGSRPSNRASCTGGRAARLGAELRGARILHGHTVFRVPPAVPTGSPG